MTDQTVDMRYRGHICVTREPGCTCQAHADALGEVKRLRKRLRIATSALGSIADRGGEDWQVADRALTRMQEVE